MAKWVYQMTPHDQWDFDGVNEMILADLKMDGKEVPALVHFDRNGFGYTMNRVTGELLVAQKFDPNVNWASKVDMKDRPADRRREIRARGYRPDVDVKDICPAALGSKDEQPSSFDPKTGLLYVPTNHVCMTTNLSKSSTPRGAALCRRHAHDVSDAQQHGGMGNFIAWGPSGGKVYGQKRSVSRSGPERSPPAGDIAFYGTLEGY